KTECEKNSSDWEETVETLDEPDVSRIIPINDSDYAWQPYPDGSCCWKNMISERFWVHMLNATILVNNGERNFTFCDQVYARKTRTVCRKSACLLQAESFGTGMTWCSQPVEEPEPNVYPLNG